MVEYKAMRIINLIENETGSSGCIAAHGLSFYVETKKHKLLFDTGPNELFIENARKLGVNLSEVDSVILRHGHYDHSGGILPFVKLNPNAKIYMQQTASKEYFAFDGADKPFRYIGIDKNILTLPQLVFLSGDFEIDDELQIFTVGKKFFPVPSTNKRLRRFSDGEYLQDDFCHEQNLLISCCDRRVLFSGCAHNGILNVLENLKAKLGDSYLPQLVLGGFHLMKKSEYSKEDEDEIEAIAKVLKSYNMHFATCHCTGLFAFEQMKKIMGESLSYVYSGDEVKL
ncbi:MAG: MBL fold metallo-hydrolase [Treponema sp.]|nr:MBL fold metallo-hydrolase [Treponema sp.]